MAKQQLKLPVAEIQRFCMRDGDGLRTVVFLKGCPLRCAWCHNPEMQNFGQEILFDKSKCISCGACFSVCPQNAQAIHPQRIFDRNSCVSCGLCADVCCTRALQTARRDMTVDDVVSVVMRDKAFYQERGGVTLSGGEPMAHPNEALALLGACKAQGIRTALETCGYFPTDYVERLCAVTDLFLYDVKDTDPTRHQAYTGVGNDLILKNLLAIDACGGRTRLRCILVAGVNTNLAHYQNLADIFNSLKHCDGVELLPYHAYAGSKMLPLGKADNGKTQWIPTKKAVEEAREFLVSQGVVMYGEA